ncbi:hypothetical protein ACS0TY_013650 [Phlomoides rotata]
MRKNENMQSALACLLLSQRCLLCLLCVVCSPMGLPPYIGSSLGYPLEIVLSLFEFVVLLSPVLGVPFVLANELIVRRQQPCLLVPSVSPQLVDTKHLLNVSTGYIFNIYALYNLLIIFDFLSKSL